MRTPYLYEQPDWPNFRWRQEDLTAPLEEVRQGKNRLLGRIALLGFDRQREAVLDTLTGDVVKSSEIEGEILDAGQVRSSVAQRLGLDIGGLKHIGRDVEGIVELMLDATQNFAQPLTDERLFGWQAALFPTGRSGGYGITAGSYRSNPVQVISGTMGRQRIHYEAPPAERVEQEMRTFLDWFNAPPNTDPVLKAGLAHLWFVTVHPFDDGNGRIARAIADMALARSEDSPNRFYSMSSQIMRERNAYYDILEQTQAETLDVTGWMDWFVGCLGRAIESSGDTISAVLDQARFWERTAGLAINERQRRILHLLLGDFKGNLTTSKWTKIAKCSHDTALVDHGILIRSTEGGRSTNYSLVNDQ